MRILREKTKTLNDFLPAGVMDRILAAGVTKRFADGQLIQQRGDEGDHICFVRSGQVVAGNFGLDGGFLASALLYPGEYYGDFSLFAGVPRSQNLWAQGATDITRVEGKTFLTLMEKEPAIARALLTISTLRNYELIEFLDVQRRLTLPARISRLLLTALEPEARSETIPCRQEDLAGMLGVSRVSIGKALKKLERQGLIKLGYGRIDVPDVARLRAQVDAEFQLGPLAQG
jgi:CRP-like cAMP-binding protein